MAHISRRQFLRGSLLLTGAALTPRFLHALTRVHRPASAGSRVLVIVQLSGGNDGLNTLLPLGNDLYYQARPRLGVPVAEAVKLTDEAALHPALQPLQPLWDNAQVSFINSVGYPNPERSHFRSMDIWHTASDADAYLASGWIGRYLDAQCSGEDCPAHTAIEANEALSLALKGERRSAFSVTEPQQLYRTVSGPLSHLTAEPPPPTGLSDLDFLYKTASQAQQSAKKIFDLSKGVRPGDAYPRGQFGNHLSMVAGLINAGLDTSVYYVELNGFDTHVGQQYRHPRLLKELATGLSAFQADITRGGRQQDVVTLVFSEFGRRVAENASGGTDHGAGNLAFLMGAPLKKPGLVTPMPDLKNLLNGDVTHQVDFRQVYATLLDKWLAADADAILGRSFERLSVI